MVGNILSLCGDVSKLILVDSVGSDKLQIRVGTAISLYKIDENQTDFVLPILAEGLKDSFLCDLIKFFLTHFISPSGPKNLRLELLSIPMTSNPFDTKNLTDSEPTKPQEPVTITTLI